MFLLGGPAFTTSRLAKTLTRLKSENPSIHAVSAHFLHLVDVLRPLSPEEYRILMALLAYGPTHSPPPITGNTFTVLPRIGTTSPWASKATDILHNCGLSQLRRVERGVSWRIAGKVTDEAKLRRALHDAMTQTVFKGEAPSLPLPTPPKPLTPLPLSTLGRAALEEARRTLSLPLSEEDMDYLLEVFTATRRNPTDVEVMMVAQANSEHCRHNIFNAAFTIDGVPQTHSLFQLIQKSTAASPKGVLSAYRDNAAVIEGFPAGRFFADADDGVYRTHFEATPILLKVETHNHPTAVSPYEGAATGAGGEIRDEGATGRGSKPKAGLSGFSTSHLKLPGARRPWEAEFGKPTRIASALDIMTAGPIGCAAFNNEFGRPSVLGYFRTFELRVPTEGGSCIRGYHKPIMLAGGLGNIRPGHVQKHTLPQATPLIVLGGAAMRIGMGGGAASSMASGTATEALDFSSVQRDNAEMQRRCQEVIDACWALGEENPILCIHDVGAGGLSNAIPELLHTSARGAHLQLRAVPSDETAMSPMELWCNEAQERYVLAVAQAQLQHFEALCRKERCPFAVLGHTTADGRLLVEDAHFGNRPIDIPVDVIVGKPPRKRIAAHSVKLLPTPFDAARLDLDEAATRVLLLPAVADKSFLITIGDRSVTGLVTQQQCVGRFQVPVADAAVTSTSYEGITGEAMALGERTPIACLNASAAARMAVGEAVTNVACAAIEKLSQLRLSANWMTAAGCPGEDARLYEAVEAIGAQLAPALGIAIPVGKDSMSMRTVWQEGGEEKSVLAPQSLIVTAFAPVLDVRRTLTPELHCNAGPTALLLLDLAAGKNRLGASALAQVFGCLGATPPDVEDAAVLKKFFELLQHLGAQGKLLAYHDRSDGGLYVTLLEMAFATGCGLDVDMSPLPGADIPVLFSEELGAVVQVRRGDVREIAHAFTACGVPASPIATPTESTALVFRRGNRTVFKRTLHELRALWSDTSWRMQRLRDEEGCADEEHALRTDARFKGLTAHTSDSWQQGAAAPSRATGGRPRIAILREQGVNGAVEMAAAFTQAGFCAVDVHMSALMDGSTRLDTFKGLAACGGFSYGDVLGAGGAWAKSALFHPKTRAALEAFFAREDTFTLGICNGCQMLAQLKALLLGAALWPRFVRNTSDQFEARLVMLRVERSPSIFFRDMEGSVLPVPVAHGEGRAEFADEGQASACEATGLIAARFVDDRSQPTMRYPLNPNGSPGGLAALTTPDGRCTILMPHPERAFRTVQLPWHPRSWGEASPWMKFFENARVWTG